MKHPMRILIALLAALALVAAPVAVAAGGGKGPEHASDNAADGQAKAAAARANSTHEDDGDEDDDSDDANDTKEKDANHTAPSGNAWGYWWKRLADDWKNLTKSGEKPWHANATAKSHADRADDDGNATKAPERKGWAKAVSHVPDRVRAFFERVLAGASPREARDG